MNQYLECDFAHITPLPNVATRKLGISHTSVTSELFSYDHPRAIWADSILENRTTARYLMDPKVKEIVPQPPAIHFVDENGIHRSHTFDFKIVYRSGRRVFLFCKYVDEIAKDRLDLWVDMVAPQIDASVADEIVIATELDYDDASVDTATVYREALRHPPSTMSRTILRDMCESGEVVTITELGARYGTLEDVYWPVIRLLAKGYLQKTGAASIGGATEVHANVERDWN